MDITAFHPFILPELSGCPNPIVNRAIVDICREFSRRTTLFRKTETFSVYANEKSYVMSPPSGNEVIKEHGVWFDGLLLPRMIVHSQYVEDDEAATPNSYTTNPQNTVNLYPIPTENYTDKLVIQFSYQPQYDNNTMYDDFERWIECVASGVKWKLMMQPNKEWTNPEFGMFNRQEWWRLMSDAREEAMRLYGNPESTANYSLDSC